MLLIPRTAWGVIVQRLSSVRSHPANCFIKMGHRCLSAVHTVQVSLLRCHPPVERLPEPTATNAR